MYQNIWFPSIIDRKWWGHETQRHLVDGGICLTFHILYPVSVPPVSFPLWQISLYMCPSASYDEQVCTIVPQLPIKHLEDTPLIFDIILEKKINPSAYY